jgi:LEA14-like dessication related protein
MNMTKKLACVSALALIVLSLTTCATLQGIVREPKVAFNSVDITGIDLDGLDLACKIDVTNPNSISIPFPRIDWDLNLNNADSAFLNGSLPGDTEIAAKKTSTVTLPLHIDYRSLFQFLASLKDAKEVAYTINATATFESDVLKMLGSNLAFSTKFSGTIPIVKAPDLSVQSFTMEKIDATAMAKSLLRGNAKLGFTLNLQVKNDNNFAMNLDSLNYTLNVNDATWTSGAVARKVSVAAGTSATIPVNFTLNAQSMVKSIWTLVTKKTPVTFSLSGEADISGSIKGLKPIKLPFNLGGNSTL